MRYRYSFTVYIFFVIFGAKTNFGASINTNDVTYLQCNMNDSAFKNCTINQIQSAIKYLGTNNGYPPLEIPTINPIYINYSLVKPADSIMFQWDFVEIKNSVLNGFKYSVVSNVVYDFGTNDTTIKCDILIPSLYIESDYHIRGRILLVPMDQEGRGYFQLQNVFIVSSLTGSNKHTNKDEIFLEIKDFQLVIRYPNENDIKMYMENLFGDNFIGSMTNKIMNYFSLALFGDWIPVLNNELQSFFELLCVKFFNVVPFSLIIK